MSKGKRILIFNVNWIGDVIFSTPVIRNLRYNFPDSFIACIIPPRCLPALQGNQYLDEIIVFDEKGRHKGLGGKIAFCAQLRKKRFDAVYLLHRSLSRAVIVFLAGIPERIGYYTRKRWFLLTRHYPAPDLLAVHRCGYYLDLLRQDGLPLRDRFTDFPVGAADREKAAAFAAGVRRDGRPLIAINPGGNWLPKRWPKENYAQLLKRLSVELGAQVVITGGPEDAALAAEIEALSGVKCVSVCGVFGLKEFAALAGMLDIFITADSGPLHIAAASGAKHIIALFGPTDPKLTGPVQSAATVIVQKRVGCAVPCYNVACGDNKCMKAITVDDVLAQVRRVVDAGKGAG